MAAIAGAHLFDGKSIFYKAVITTKEDNDAKEYIGMTANRFKERYGNHKKSFNDPKDENETELSEYQWKGKNAAWEELQY